MPSCTCTYLFKHLIGHHGETIGMFPKGDTGTIIILVVVGMVLVDMVIIVASSLAAVAQIVQTFHPDGANACQGMPESLGAGHGKRRDRFVVSFELRIEWQGLIGPHTVVVVVLVVVGRPVLGIRRECRVWWLREKSRSVSRLPWLSRRQDGQQIFEIWQRDGLYRIHITMIHRQTNFVDLMIGRQENV